MLLSLQNWLHEPLRNYQPELSRFVGEAPTSVAMFDPDMRYLAYSRLWLAAFGRGHQDLLGRDHYEIHPDQPEGWRAVHQRALAGESVRSDEELWRQADGREVWVRWAVVPWHDESGGVGGIVIAAEDISERKRTEKELSQSQALLLGIVNSAMDAIVCLDEQMRIRLVNPTAERLFGYRADQLYGESLDRLIPQPMREAHRQHLARFAQREVDSRFMTELRDVPALRADGTEFFAEVSIAKTELDGQRYFTAILRDVTARNALLQKSRDSQQRVELALEGANLDMWELDITAQRFSNGPRLPVMLGFAPGEIDTDQAAYQARLHPGDLGRARTAFQAHLQGLAPRVEFEYRMRGKDGHWVWLLTRGRIVERDADGRPLRMAGTTLDISEAKSFQERERRMGRAFQLLSRCDSALVHATDEANLLREICALAVEVGGHLMAWVGFMGDDVARSVHAVAWHGLEDGYLQHAAISWSDSERGRGPFGVAVRTRKPVIVQHLPSDPSVAPWRDAILQRGYHSCIALPLLIDQAPIGAILIYSADPLGFGKDEAKLLEQLAADLAYGIRTLRTRAEHEQARMALQRESAKNRALLRSASDGIHVLDTGGHLVEASDSFCRMLGYTREELIGAHVSQWDAMLDSATLAQVLRENFARQERTQFETRHRCKDGTLIDVEISGYPLQTDGVPVLFNSSRDITERKRAGESLRASEARFRAVVEQSPVAMVFARAGIVLDVNAAYLQTFGLQDVEQIRGRSVLERIAPQCRAELAERIGRRGRGETVEQDYEILGLRRDGTEFPLFISARQVLLPDGPVTVAFLIDVSRQKASEDEARRLAFYDPLTDLPNRRLLLDRLAQALAASARSGKHGALLFIDLDNFKTLNDTLGHRHRRRVAAAGGRAPARLRARGRLRSRAWAETSSWCMLEDLSRAAARGRAAGGGRGREDPRHAAAASYRLGGHTSTTAPPASASACSAAARTTGRDLLRRPTSPCTRPRRPGATASASSTRRCRQRHHSRDRAGETCAGRWRRASSACTYQPQVDSARPTVRRRGADALAASASAAWCRRRSSFRWPKKSI